MLYNIFYIHTQQVQIFCNFAGKMKALVKIVFLMTCVICPAVSHASFPMVRNFPTSIHPGGSQTWQIGCDTLGRMIFGNKNGLLEFDSNRWQITGLPHGSTVRSFLLDKGDDGSRRIYVGGSEEFGYYESDARTGARRYVSLTGLLPEGFPSYREVWKVHRMEGSRTVWFQADNEIFRYDGSKVTPIHVNSRITTSAVVGGHLFIAAQGEGVYELIDRRLQPVERGDLPADARIVEILPYHNHMTLVVTEYDGLFIIESGRLRTLPTDMDMFLKSNQVFCAAAKGGRYAFGTVGMGVVVKNFASGRIAYANTSTGLQNNTVLAMYFDDDMNLWLGLDNGIDMVMTSLPYYSLLGKSSAYGAGYMSLRSGNRLYLGTNQGLYAVPDPMPDSFEPPELKPIMRGQVWDISEVEGDVFVCTDAGVSYSRGGGAFVPVTGLGGSWCVMPMAGYPGYVLVSTYGRLHVIRRDGGVWHDTGEVSGYDDIGGHLKTDGEGNYWMPHWLKGMYRLRIDPLRRRVVSKTFYDSRNGFPTNHNTGMVMFGGRPLFSTEGGFYRLGDDGVMHPDTSVNKLLGVAIAPSVHISPAGDIWCVTGNSITRAWVKADGTSRTDTVTYSPIARHLIPGFMHFDFVDDNRLIVAMQEGFFDVDLSDPGHQSPPRKLFFSSVTAYGDSTEVYYPAEADLGNLSIPYGMNSLRFEVVSPEYRGGENAVVYSYLLENCDADWSAFAPGGIKEYTQLGEGDYVMRVRAYNTFTKRTQESSVAFTVTPPWFRSVWAKLAYTLLILAGFWLTYRTLRDASRRSSRRVAEKKEKELEDMRRAARQESLEKDYEIAELKSRQLELDVKHKAEELSNITMNVVRKNEILLDISQRLDRMHTEGASAETLKEIAKIKSLIKKNISHDDDWRNFLHNFDTAYDDFARRLSETHPGLTQTELRVCCYLRMGLSSKDIAPLFNISYRSVEMTRYRVRKKLGMDRDVNLADYLQNFGKGNRDEGTDRDTGDQ